MQLKLDRRFKEHVQARFDRFEMQVGILEDRPHKNPKPASTGLGEYAGSYVRKKSNVAGPLTVAQVSESIRARFDLNYLTEPFERKNSDIVKFSDGFFKMAASSAGASMQKRVVNLMQAIVRNPILRGDYGMNSKTTAKEKGFNRFLIDTGQFFKSITASVKIRGGRNV